MRFEADTVDAFFDFLAELSLDDWLAIGAQASAPAAPTTVAILDATLADQCLSVDAWLACDAVETIVSLASSAMPAAERGTQRAMARAKSAAQQAARAILARRWLARSDLEALLSPFSPFQAKERQASRVA
jgi:hypothetical protein